MEFYNAPPVPAPATEVELLKPGHSECVVVAILVAVCAIIWARHCGVGTSRGEGGRGVTRAFARPEAGRVIV